MINARSRIEQIFENAPAAPPKPATRPTTKPAPSPSRPSPKPNTPWRRKSVKPGSEPGPKARSEALEFLRVNGFEEFV